MLNCDIGTAGLGSVGEQGPPRVEHCRAGKFYILSLLQYTNSHLFLIYM